jgi:hypothetical protein
VNIIKKLYYVVEKLLQCAGSGRMDSGYFFASKQCEELENIMGHIVILNQN